MKTQMRKQIGNRIDLTVGLQEFHRDKGGNEKNHVACDYNEMSTDGDFKRISDQTGRTAAWDASNNVEEESVVDRDPDIQAVVEGCKANDRIGQRQLYDIFHRDVYHLMVRMVGSQNAADLLQQVFLQTFRKIDRFSGRSSFKTWLYRLAMNEALQHIRRSRRDKYHALEYDPMDEQPGHEQRSEQKDLLDAALNQLHPELRSIFLLRETENLSYKEIADVLQISEGTVASRLNRARRELKKLLVDLGWEP